MGGFDSALLSGVGAAPQADYAATIPHLLFAVYQCMFVIITPALISGAIVECMKFSAYFVLGKRADFGKASTAASNIPVIAIGTGLLWFGWFGFNGGSALGSSELSVAAFSSTHFAAAAAGLAWAAMDEIMKGKLSLVGICIGIVVGFVGTVLTGVFASKAINAAGADGGIDQVIIQLKSSLVVGMVIGLRPTAQDESTGLDQADRGEKADVN